MCNFSNQLYKSHQQVNLALKQYLLLFFKRDISLLLQAMRYGVLLGGKRLRPFLVYQIGKLFGIESAHLDAPAAAIECMHTYSLLHDDLPAMDNDIVRRGYPACHVKFGEAIAILAGNSLHTLAFTILSEAGIPNITDQDRLRMISTLAAASGAQGLCLGQSLDVIMKNNQNISSLELETIYQYKTGSLIRAAVRIGALASGNVNKKVLECLDNYAATIGLAFQIQDDIVDILNDSQKKNKMQEGYAYVNTYPKLLGLNTARSVVQSLCYKSLESLKYIEKLGYNVNVLSKFTHYVIKRDY